MKKLLILQNTILHYRKPLYNELSRYYDVTILHSGDKSVGIDGDYKEIITSVKRIGPFFLQSGVLKAVRSDDYDVVIAMFDIRWGSNIIAVFLKSNSRFLYWGHRYSKNRFVNKIRDLLMHLSDGVILYSNTEISRMISRGMPKFKIFVAPNTIYVPNFSDGSSAYKDSFLYVGRLQKRKKVDLLIRAFSEIIDCISKNIKINIVGSGEEHDNLKKTAEHLGVSDRVVFHGEIVNSEKLKPLFYSAYAYVSPGPVGLGVLHSFAYGIPVVANCSIRHGPEFDNISDYKNALLYKTYDEFKAILVSLCSNKNISMRLGKNAYKLYAQDRTIERMVKGFRQAIEDTGEQNTKLNIFINGLKSKTGGGKSILNNYLSLLKESRSKNRFIILTPDQNEYKKYSSDFIEIIDIKNLYKKNLLFPLLYHFVIPKFLKDYNIDAILNFGDIVIPTNIPQVYLFDWSYAVYPNSIAWKRMDLKSYLTRKIKLFVLKKNIKYATVVVAQTKTIKKKLESIYGLKNIEIIPNAVSLQNLNNNTYFNFDLSKNKIKLLYLTHYYSHKNLEIFIPLAKEIKKRRLKIQIITTIGASQHPNAKKFLNDIKKFKLEDVLHNIGPVDMKCVPALYQQVDGLLMPTLLESFSGTYIEAMFHKIPILTSNMDFARDICGKSANYFDPLDVNSILSSINQVFQNHGIRIQRIKEGDKRLKKLLTWEQAFKMYQKILNRSILKFFSHSECLAGKKLYGDNLSLREIKKWYTNEEDGYANLGAKNRKTYQYVYHEIDKLLGFSYINNAKIKNALGLGSAWGDEFLPIINKIQNITILDPSKHFSRVTKIQNVPCKYITPNINGDMPFASNQFELILCLSVLHHIPNVTHIMEECNRVLADKGIMLVREPIVSMGDWSKKRKRLTKNERGIPLDIFKSIIVDSGFKIEHQSLWDFSLISRIFNKFGIYPYNNKVVTKFDVFISNSLQWNIKYHATKFIHKFRPASIYFVLVKNQTGSYK